ncbi:MAG: site-2 protease family protein [Actinomycetota bacterium]
MDIGLLPILRDDPATFVLLAIGLMGAIALHEFSHALAADLQGDRLPRAMGRLTLNPLRHLDPLGSLCIVLAGFGWGKPVEFRPQALASRRFGAAIVALAGPLMNLALAILAALALKVTTDLDDPDFGAEGLSVGTQFLLLFLGINVILAVFNLLPVPPLDGSRLLTIFLPPRRHNIIYFLDQYGILILLVIVFFGAGLLDPIFRFVGRPIFELAGI